MRKITVRYKLGEEEQKAVYSLSDDLKLYTENGELLEKVSCVLEAEFSILSDIGFYGRIINMEVQDET